MREGNCRKKLREGETGGQTERERENEGGRERERDGETERQTLTGIFFLRNLLEEFLFVVTLNLYKVGSNTIAIKL